MYVTNPLNSIYLYINKAITMAISAKYHEIKNMMTKHRRAPIRDVVLQIIHTYIIHESLASYSTCACIKPMLGRWEVKHNKHGCVWMCTIVKLSVEGHKWYGHRHLKKVTTNTILTDTNTAL